MVSEPGLIVADPAGAQADAALGASAASASIAVTTRAGTVARFMRFLPLYLSRAASASAASRPLPPKVGPSIAQADGQRAGSHLPNACPVFPLRFRPALPGATKET